MTTIAIDKHTHKDAKTLCKTYELNLGELVQHSVVYFKKTGINPSQADNESPHKVLKELEKRIGQVVAFIKTHEQEKLNPLLEHLIIISRQLDDTIKILPTVEHFKKVTTNVDKYIAAIKDNHTKQVALLKEEQQKINQQNQTERNTLTSALNNLTKAFNTLQAGQKEINNTIETKLRKNLLGK